MEINHIQNVPTGFVAGVVTEAIDAGRVSLDDVIRLLPDEMKVMFRGSLKRVEDGLVPVYETDQGVKVVYGRELHEVLGVKTQYKDWSKRRLDAIDAVEGEDYEKVKECRKIDHRSKMSAGKPPVPPEINHIILLDTAKEMAMLERNQKGKQVRRYFIEIEKRYRRQGVNPFMPLEDKLDGRMRMLNHLTEQVAEKCGIFKNRVLHYLYITIEDIFGISSNAYLTVYRSETNRSACFLHVIASYDRFYEKAVDLCEWVIGEKGECV